MRRILIAIVLVLLIPALYLSTVIIYSTITKYKPEDIQQLSKLEDVILLSGKEEYSVMIWNIGYAGLGAGMDFFYDGGSRVRDTEENVRENLFRIAEFLRENDTIDFILLQEVDKQAKRSYNIDMTEQLNFVMAGHFPFYTENYKVDFVPVPFFNPMGKVVSGIMSFSQHIPYETKRYAYPGNFLWPKSLYMPNRCFLEKRFKMDSGKDLVIVNLHNSAFDDGRLRKGQLDHIKSYLINEDKKGNTFLVGGDWNQSPPGFRTSFREHILDTTFMSIIPEGFLQPGWNWHFDGGTPTNRNVSVAYEPPNTPVSLLDFFLVSGNVDVTSCQTIDLGFSNSDHNPVILSFNIE